MKLRVWWCGCSLWPREGGLKPEDLGSVVDVDETSRRLRASVVTLGGETKASLGGEDEEMEQGWYGEEAKGMVKSGEGGIGRSPPIKSCDVGVGNVGKRR